MVGEKMSRVRAAVALSDVYGVRGVGWDRVQTAVSIAGKGRVAGGTTLRSDMAEEEAEGEGGLSRGGDICIA